MSNIVIVNGINVFEELEKKEKLLEHLESELDYLIKNYPIDMCNKVFNSLCDLSNKIKENQNETID